MTVGTGKRIPKWDFETGSPVSWLEMKPYLLAADGVLRHLAWSCTAVVTGGELE